MNSPTSFRSLSPSVIENSSKAILWFSDVTIAVGTDGLIREISLGASLGNEAAPEGLRNRPVLDCVDAADRPALSALIEAARTGPSITTAKVRHKASSGLPARARYAAYISGDHKTVMLLGRALDPGSTPFGTRVEAELARASHSPDRGSLEARYHLLFRSAAEAILFVDPVTTRIEEANPNAGRLFGRTPEQLIGARLEHLFMAQDREEIENLIAAAGNDGGRHERSVQIAENGRAANLSSQIVRSFERPALMVRITPERSMSSDRGGNYSALAGELIRQSNVPAAMTDLSRDIMWANEAFRNFVTQKDVMGRNVTDLLGLSTHVLTVALRDVESRGRLLVPLAGLTETPTDNDGIEVAILWVSDESQVGYGFVLNPPAILRPEGEDVVSPDHDALTRMVGRAPMRDLVRETTEVIERDCIKAALRLTDNNRAAAATVLGLSRQSLYIKLRQFDLL